MKRIRGGNHTRVMIKIETLLILFLHLEKIVRRWRRLLLEDMEIVKRMVFKHVREMKGCRWVINWFSSFGYKVNYTSFFFWIFLDLFFYECWWRWRRRWEKKMKKNKKDLVLIVQSCIQWTCNQTVENISKNLDIKKLTERTTLGNGGRLMGPNWNTL